MEGNNLIMDSTKEFNGLSGVYELGRPTYSNKFIDDLFIKYGFGDKSIVADIGSGTGKFAKQIIERGPFVYCVEPNDDMRNQAIRELKFYRNCKFVKGDASDTTLEAKSVDFITTAQAFHWFDERRFRTECSRILKPNGKVFLIWNMRDMNFEVTRESYNIYRKYCPKFKGFGGGIQKDDSRIINFFSTKYERYQYNNNLTFQKDKFLYRSLSGSYSLQPGDMLFEAYREELERLFDKYAVDGVIEMPNKTVVYVGTITA